MMEIYNTLFGDHVPIGVRGGVLLTIIVVVFIIYKVIKGLIWLFKAEPEIKTEEGKETKPENSHKNVDKPTDETEKLS